MKNLGLKSVDKSLVWSDMPTTLKAVVASSEKNLQRLMDSVSRDTQEYGMKINVKKTKAICITRQGKSKVKIYIDGQLLEQVQQFRYLGSLITEDG